MLQFHNCPALLSLSPVTMRVPGHSSAFPRTSSSSSLPSLQLTLSSVKRGASGMNRIDIALIVLLILPLTVYLEFYASARVQPVELTDPALLKPFLPSLVSSRAVLFLSFVIPPIVHFIALRRAVPMLAFVSGLTQTNFLTLCATNTLKVIVGRPRPFFATLCKTYDPPQSTMCTGSTAHLIDDARRSFPSGHSSLTFSAGMFLALCFAKMVFSSYNSIGTVWSFSGSKMIPMLIVIAPLSVSTLVAASRLVDFHHHYSDVVAGSMLGSFFAIITFLSHFYPHIFAQTCGTDDLRDAAGTPLQADAVVDDQNFV